MRAALVSLLLGMCVVGCAPAPPTGLTSALHTTWVASPTPDVVAWRGLVDGSGQPVAAQAGRWTWVMIGYTGCPDVCPTGLKGLGALLSEHDVDGIFVSVDPQRDTGGRLDEYASWFHPRLRAATGSREDLDRFVDSLGASYALPSDTTGEYAVEHSVAAFLIDPSGRRVGVSARPADATSLVGDHESAVRGSVAARGLQIPARPPGTKILAAYGALSNDSPRPRRIVQVRSPLFEEVEIHRTVQRNGAARMDHLKELTLPAASSVHLTPGGMHLMLFYPSDPLPQDVPIEFVLDDGVVLTSRAEVLSP